MIIKDYYSHLTVNTDFDPIGLFTVTTVCCGSSTPISSWVTDFEIEFVDAQDGNDHSSDWNGQVNAYATSSGSTVIYVLKTAFLGDHSAGWHRFKLKPHVSSDYYYVQGTIYFLVNKRASTPVCTLTTFMYDTATNTVNHLSVTSQNHVYYVQTTQVEIEFQKFVTVDIDCIQDYQRLKIEKTNSDGSYTTYCDDAATCSFMSLVWDTNHLDSTKNHKLLVHTTDMNEVGDYRISIKSGITSGANYEEMTFILQIKNWCEQVKIQYTQALTSTEYYIWDETHPIVVAKDERNKKVTLGSLDFVLSTISPAGLPNDIKANVQSRNDFFITNCGLLILSPQMKDGTSYATDSRIDLEASHSSANGEVDLTIFSQEKTIIPSDATESLLEIKVFVYFADFSSIQVQIDFQTTFIDPCNTMLLEFN